MSVAVRKQIIERLAEPSTYAGLSMLVALLGVGAEDWQTYSAALAGGFAVVAMLLKEGPKDSESKK